MLGSDAVPLVAGGQRIGAKNRFTRNAWTATWIDEPQDLQTLCPKSIQIYELPEMLISIT